MKKIVTVLLCALLMFSGFAACKEKETENDKKQENVVSNKDRIIGTWEATIDMTEMMKEVFSSDDTMASFVQVPEFSMKMTFTFNENSLMVMAVDEDSVSESFSKLMEEVKAGLNQYFEQVLEENQLDITVEELLQMSNLDLDQLVDEMSEAAIEAMDLESLSYQCYYEIDGDRLYSYDTVGGRDEEEYIELSFADNNTLKFVSVQSEEENELMDLIGELKRTSGNS